MIITIIISITIIIIMIIIIIVIIIKRNGRRLAIPVQNPCVATSAAGKRVKLSLHYFFERHSDVTVQVCVFQIKRNRIIKSKIALPSNCVFILKLLLRDECLLDTGRISVKFS